LTRDTIAAHQGSTVKTMGDGVMGAFYRLDDALAAAIEMQHDISDWCATQEIEPALVLKIGIHHGPVIAMNANDRLDYFGRTANVAARLGAQSQGGDIVLLKEVYEEALSASNPALADLPVEPFKAHLRGVEGELVRLTVAPKR
jgi:class 3 adenylate cyclase